MSDIVIQVENLSKYYNLGVVGTGTLSHDLNRAWAKLRGKPDPTLRIDQTIQQFNNSTGKASDDYIWALRDISFEVKQGEILGIIGRNGAGKSTLLKILSRVTAPTSGECRVKGRIASLLEVGTGFHPELTGRENIFLNGAILGMTKEEIKQKFDEIVAFAEVEKFIDTPVKRYSSGMYVRLAFAVAAHLEPEILVIDEVLAVGDAQFQKKCLWKMGDVSKEGRTVLFVSHNMVAVQSLCQKVMLLDKGEMVQNGPANQIVSNYLRYCLTSTQMDQVWKNQDEAPGCEEVRFRRISIQINDQDNNMITMETPFLVIVEYWNEIPAACLHITLHIRNEQGIVAFTTGSCQEPGWNGQSLEKGIYRSICHMPKNLLNSGRHSITILVVRDLANIIYMYEDALVFDIVDNRDRSGGWFGKEPGVVQPYLEWKTEYVGSKIPSQRLLKR
ncbi:MAG: ABC transporter ATP-binding protein [Deltaproteobacteria bacterium]|nr:ABC transporter ATP-binding protein [Deltaproteobacteria bacterium]